MKTTTKVILNTVEATQALAQQYAQNARVGQTFLLSGDLGAGKSSFARAFLRTLFDSPDLDVPSPTYTLVQVYGEEETSLIADCLVYHLDLYRLLDCSEVAELGLDYENAITLIEWPERLPDDEKPEHFTHVQFFVTPDTGGRIAHITVTE